MIHALAAFQLSTLVRKLPASSRVRPRGLVRRSQPHGLLLVPREKPDGFLPSLSLKPRDRCFCCLGAFLHSPWGWLASLLLQSTLGMGQGRKGKEFMVCPARTVCLASCQRLYPCSVFTATLARARSSSVEIDKSAAQIQPRPLPDVRQPSPSCLRHAEERLHQGGRVDLKIMQSLILKINLHIFA